VHDPSARTADALQLACFVALLAKQNRGSGLTRTYPGAAYPPGHYDIDLSRIVPKRVSHLQVQLLPRIDAQLGVIEAIVDDNPKRTIREVSWSSVLEKSREQFLSTGKRGHPNVNGRVPISPAEVSCSCRISARKENCDLLRL
jgi:hypothetical protein